MSLLLRLIFHKVVEPLLYLILCMLVAVGLAWLASHAEAKTSTDQEMPAIRPERPADAKQDKKLCYQQIRTIRFLIGPDGKMEYAGGFTMWAPCE